MFLLLHNLVFWWVEQVVVLVGVQNHWNPVSPYAPGLKRTLNTSFIFSLKPQKKLNIKNQMFNILTKFLVFFTLVEPRVYTFSLIWEQFNWVHKPAWDFTSFLTFLSQQSIRLAWLLEFLTVIVFRNSTLCLFRKYKTECHYFSKLKSLWVLLDLNQDKSSDITHSTLRRTALLF